MIGTYMKSVETKSFRKALAFWFASVLTVGIMFVANGFTLGPVVLGAILSLGVLLYKQFGGRKK